MAENKICEALDSIKGNTVAVKKECAEFCGLSLRTIQILYSDKKKIPSMATILKIQEFLSLKNGREVHINEIIENRKTDILKSGKAILKKV